MLCNDMAIRPLENQVFDCTTFVLEVLTVHGKELRQFWVNYFTTTLTKYIAHHLTAAVGTIFNV